MSKYKDYVDIPELTAEAEFNYYLGKIQDYKIYDIDWSSILKVKSEKIKKILKGKSTIAKTYEKKKH